MPPCGAPDALLRSRDAVDGGADGRDDHHRGPPRPRRLRQPSRSPRAPTTPRPGASSVRRRRGRHRRRWASPADASYWVGVDVSARLVNEPALRVLASPRTLATVTDGPVGIASVVELSRRPAPAQAEPLPRRARSPTRSPPDASPHAAGRRRPRAAPTGSSTRPCSSRWPTWPTATGWGPIASRAPAPQRPRPGWTSSPRWIRPAASPGCSAPPTSPPPAHPRSPNCRPTPLAAADAAPDTLTARPVLPSPTRPRCARSPGLGTYRRGRSGSGPPPASAPSSRSSSPRTTSPPSPPAPLLPDTALNRRARSPRSPGPPAARSAGCAPPPTSRADADPPRGLPRAPWPSVVGAAGVEWTPPRAVEDAPASTPDVRDPRTHLGAT